MADLWVNLGGLLLMLLIIWWFWLSGCSRPDCANERTASHSYL